MYAKQMEKQGRNRSNRTLASAYLAITPLKGLTWKTLISYDYGTSSSNNFSGGIKRVNYYNGTDWSVAIEGAGNWGGGPQAMHVTTWNGKKILAFMQMGYTWWDEGWGMPSYLWIADVTDPANAIVLSNAVYDNLEDQIISGGTENSSLDVLPVVDGNDLVVYFVDSSQGHLAKVRFPKL
jgi:hypothetical protein